MSSPLRLVLKNREISWLSFNDRVLQEACDSSVPLLERLKYLSIFSSNLDEFYRVRVATLQRIADLKGVGKKSESVTRHLLSRIQQRVLHQQDLFLNTYQQINTELAKAGIRIINETQLSDPQKLFVHEFFEREVLPALVPIMLEAANPFADLKDHAIYFIVRMFRGEQTADARLAFMEVPSPDIVPRFLQLPSKDGTDIILIDDIIRFHLPEIFAVFEVDRFEAYIIKVTRDAELTIDNDVAQRLVEKMTRTLKQRKKGRPVRLVYDASMPDDLLKLLMRRLNLVTTDNLIPGGRYHNFKDFFQFPRVGPKSLYYKQPAPALHPGLLTERSVFKAIAMRDVLLYYPYHSFDVVLRFLREAAIDPSVKSIQITMYRLAKQSKVINALINAIKNGKTVTVVVELLARFDEEANMNYARQLEDEGAKVIYSPPSMKVHCKMCLVHRIEDGHARDYVYLSTGNFNESTSRSYCDFGFFSADKFIAQDVRRLFQHLENPESGTAPSFRHLLVSPLTLRPELLRLIDREVEHVRSGKDGSIVFKVNNLVDPGIIEKLLWASQQGVSILLIVRSACALVPGIVGYSDKIEVISIIDKFLEHARLFFFGNASNPDIFLSSADLMTRNLDHRIELAWPVYDAGLRFDIERLLDLQIRDNVKARRVDRAQKNRYRRTGQSAVRSQEALHKLMPLWGQAPAL